jgi:terminase small subunit-like protein
MISSQGLPSAFRTATGAETPSHCRQANALLAGDCRTLPRLHREGMTVAAALQHEGMPVKQTILNWTKAHPEFRREYDAASRSAISFGWTSASILQMVRSRREGAVEKPASIPAGSSLPRRQMEPLVGGMTTPMSRPRTGSTSIQFTTSSVNGNLRHGGEAVKVLIDPRVGNH